MSKTSSAPKYTTYSFDSNINNNKNDLPRISVSPLVYSSKYSDQKKDTKSDYKEKDYHLYNNNNLSNMITNINDNLNRKLRANNEVAQNQINSIKNNYEELRYLLDEKTNKLENNQNKIIDYMKHSLEQNDINDNKYNNNYINNSTNKENLIRALNQVPSMIQNKINQIYKEEKEENRNQNMFLNKLKEEVITVLRNQRKQDDLRYKQHIEELRKLKDNEEKEKIQLIDELQQRRNNYQIQKNNLRIYKYKKPKLKYNNESIAPFYENNLSQIIPQVPFYYQNPNQMLQGMNNNLMYNGGKNLSIDEIIKFYLFKEMMNNDFYRQQRYFEKYDNYLPNIKTCKYPKMSHSHSVESYYHEPNDYHKYHHDKYRHKYIQRTNISNNMYKSNGKSVSNITDNKKYINITNKSINENISQENLIPFGNIGTSFTKKRRM